MEQRKPKQRDLIIFLLIDFVSIYIIIFGSKTASEDTFRLIEATSHMLDCLRNEIFISCPGMWHFPLSQFISAAFFTILGLSTAQIVSALVSLNLVAFLASIVLFYRAGTRWADRASGVLLAAILLSGYGLAYSSFSFNELTAFFFITSFVYACLFKWNLAIILLLNIAAGITKEIAPPFLLGMALLVIIINWDRNKSREQLKFVLILFLGFIVSLAINGMFNYFRYSSFQNIQLLAKAYIVPNVRVWADYFLMLIFSPNGGLISAWPTWCGFSLILLVQGIRSSKDNAKWELIRNTLPAVGFLGLLLVLHTGLAKWWAPFGSTAWGPRLTLPYLGGLLLILCAANKRILPIISYHLLSNRNRAIIIGCVFGFLSIPHILMVIAPDQVISLPKPSIANAFSSIPQAIGQSFFDLIPHGTGEVLIQSQQYFYLISREEAWLSGSIYMEELGLLKNPTNLLSVLLYAVLFPTLFLFAHKFTQQLNISAKEELLLFMRPIYRSLGIFILTGSFLLLIFHMHPDLNIQLLGFSPTPQWEVNEKQPTPNNCDFVVYRLAIRELGLITNLSIKSQTNKSLIWSTDAQDESLSLWVAKEGGTNSLLNQRTGNIRIPIVEPTTLLLYGPRNCATDQVFQNVEVFVNYSDNRILSATVSK